MGKREAMRESNSKSKSRQEQERKATSARPEPFTEPFTEPRKQNSYKHENVDSHADKSNEHPEDHEKDHEPTSTDHVFELTLYQYFNWLLVLLACLYLLTLYVRDDRMFLQEFELRSFVLNILVDLMRGFATQVLLVLLFTRNNELDFRLTIPVIIVIFIIYVIALASHFYHALEYHAMDVLTGVTFSIISDLSCVLWPFKLTWNFFVWFTLLCGGRHTLTSFLWDMFGLLVGSISFFLRLLPSVAVISSTTPFEEHS